MQHYVQRSNAGRPLLLEAGATQGGRVDRERGHCCLFSRSPSEPDIQRSKYPALQFPY